MSSAFVINRLSVAVQDTAILHDITLTCEPGSIHALMGPNGSGKTTLALALAGHPTYHVTSGQVSLAQEELLSLPVHKRVHAGFFLTFQQPCEIPGVPVATFLKACYQAVHGHITPQVLRERAMIYFDILQMDRTLYDRNMHEGFSGGQRKKMELLQLLLLKPKVALLDEIDSGLDVDALKAVAQALAYAREENPELITIMITHYRLLPALIRPHAVHLLAGGRLVHTGSAELIEEIDRFGYERYIRAA